MFPTLFHLSPHAQNILAVVIVFLAGMFGATMGYESGESKECREETERRNGK